MCESNNKSRVPLDSVVNKENEANKTQIDDTIIKRKERENIYI